MPDSKVIRQGGAPDDELRIGAACLRTVTSADRIRVLQLTGEVDLSNGPDLAEALQRVGPPVEHVELDVRYLQFCDVRGLRAIITAQQQLWMRNVCLQLTGVRASLSLVLSLTGLDQQLFPCSWKRREVSSTDDAVRTSMGSTGNGP